ncbi:MAG: FAD-dependent oxidoreductase [Bryobacterales bacterium]|nr:FAD-dependent oxidoreductase [Bryobacterales bacterium]
MIQFANCAQFDVAVYGGSAAGVTAAVQADRMGRRVVLVAVVAPEKHLGGAMGEGLGSLLGAWQSQARAVANNSGHRTPHSPNQSASRGGSSRRGITGRPIHTTFPGLCVRVRCTTKVSYSAVKIWDRLASSGGPGSPESAKHPI